MLSSWYVTNDICALSNCEMTSQVKKTQFLDLPKGLRQEGHPTVKLSASIKSCKMSNVMPYNGAISNRDGVTLGTKKLRCGRIQTVIQQPLCKTWKLRVSSSNVGTMHGRASEVVETISRRRIDIWCVQESRWKGCSVRFISAKGFK